MYLKNIARNNSLPITSSQTVYEQIEILSNEFGDGMFYGFIMREITGPCSEGFYTVTLRCANECVASTRFLWNPEKRIDVYVGESVNIVETIWEIPTCLLEEYSSNIVESYK